MSTRSIPSHRECSFQRAGKKKLSTIRRLSVVLLSGSVICGLVALGLTSSATAQSYGGEHAITSLIALVAANCCMVLFAVIGFTGLVRKSIKMMKIAFSLLALVGILYAGVAIFAHLKLTNLKAKLSRAIRNFMDLYGSQLGRLHNGDEVLDDIQRKRHCCGADSPTDWKTTKYGRIPPSCCHVPKDCLSLGRHNESFQSLLQLLEERNEEMKLVEPAFYNRGCVEPMTELYQVANDVIVPSAGFLSALALMTFSLLCTYSCIFVNSSQTLPRRNTLPSSRRGISDPAGVPIARPAADRNSSSGGSTGSDFRM